MRAKINYKRMLNCQALEFILNQLQDKDYYTKGKNLLNRLNEINFPIKYIGQDLRDIIKQLRAKGHPIIANTRGYKLLNFESEEQLKELELYINSRRKELKSESIVINTLISKLREKGINI